MLKLWHDMHWYRTYLHPWILLTYHPIYDIHYLVAETSLTDCSSACGNHKRPENWRSNQTNSTDGCFVEPFLLTDHSDCATSSMLQNNTERCLEAEEHHEVTALFQLDHHLIFVANLLNLVTLYAKHVFKVIGEPFKVYFFAIVVSGIHKKHKTR